jgi:hypothetical protein
MGTLQNIKRVQTHLNGIEELVKEGEFEIAGQLFLLEKGVMKHKFTFE